MKKLTLTMKFEFPEDHFTELMEADELTLEEAVQQELEDGNINLEDYLVSEEQNEEVDNQERL